MKKLISYLLLGVVVASLTACSESIYDSRLRELIIEDMTFDCGASTQTQTFRHEDLSNYECESSETWCSTTLDCDNSQLMVSVTTNDTYDARTAIVKIADKNDDTARSFNVTQERNTGLFIGDTDFEASQYGDTITVDIESNVNYEVQIPSNCDWVKLGDDASQTRGLENSSFNLYISENNTYEERKASITVTNKDEGLSGTVNIHQGFETVFEADVTSFDVDMDGDVITINMNSNIDYETVIPEDCDWITLYAGAESRALKTSAINLKVAENDSYHDRNAVVTVRNQDAGAEILIKIHQGFELTFSIDKQEVTMDEDGGTFTVNLESNIDYNVSIPEDCDWITQPASGRAATTKALVFQVGENKSYKKRSAVITISNKEAGADAKITVTQTFSAVFKADKTSFEANMSGDKITVTMESNVRYDVRIPDDCDWITRSTDVRTRATKSSTVVLDVSENTTYKERDATITICNDSADVSVKISIHQPYDIKFEADKTDFDVDMDGGTFTVNIESNIPYDINIPEDCVWITTNSSSRTRASKTKAIKFRAKANDTYKDRDATITIGNEELEQEIKLSVHQPFTTEFKADKTEFDVDASGGNVTVTLSSNVDYEVSIPSDCDWVSQPTAGRDADMTRATSSTAIVFRVKENTGYEERDVTITISNANTGSVVKVYIHQKGISPTLTINGETKFEVDNEGGAVSVSVESNVDYDVTIPTDCNWITLASEARTRASKASTVKLKVDKNGTYKDREATVTIGNKDAGVEKTVTIKQLFTAELKTDKTEYDIDASGGTVTVSVESNISYEVSIPSDCDWVTQSTTESGRTRATEKSTVIFRVKENTGYEKRDVMITISNKDAGKSAQIQIRQQALTPTLTVDKNEFEVANEGGTVSVSVESNVDYDVTIPTDCNWITLASEARTRASKTSTVKLKVDKNGTYKDREATVTIGNKDAGVEKTVTIKQLFTAELKTDKTEYDIDASGGTITVSVESNINYEVSIPSDCDWVTQSTSGSGRTRATEKSTEIFRVKENTSYEKRDVTITISNKDAGKSVQIQIRQQELTPTLNVTPNEFEVPMKGETITINVESNVNYEVKIPSDCDWVTKASSVRTRATKSSVVTLTVSKNTSGSERSTTVIICDSKEVVSKSITITQKFDASFSVDDTPQEIDELGGTIEISVTANVDVEVKPQVTWLSVGKKTNEGDGYWTQQITVESLTSKVESRTGKVQFRYAAGGKTVNVEITQKHLLYISESEITLTEVDATKELTLNNSEAMKVKWTSSDEKVATVNSSGKVSAVGKGKAVITVKSEDGKYSDTVDVVVDIEEDDDEEGEGG